MDIPGGLKAGLAGRYALALFDLAREQKALEAVAASLATLKAALAESDDLKALVASPTVGRGAAGAAMAAVAQTLGLDPLTVRFLGVLAANGRLAQLPAIMRAFAELAAAFRNEVVAEVTSAHPLDGDQVNALKGKLAQRYRRDIAVELTVDRAILGGLVVRVGSQQIDGSIRTKLNNLAHAMKG